MGMEKYGVRQGKVVQLCPAPSKVEADIKAMPPPEPVSEDTARRVRALQLEVSWAPKTSLPSTLVLVLALVVGTCLALSAC